MHYASGALIRSKYRIVRLLGDGGMGSVYEAEHVVLNVKVALKFLHTELARRPGLAERFLQEARVSAMIQDPHVARVTDVDTTEDASPFLVMELLHGDSLQAVLDREKSVDVVHAVEYGLQILTGLAAAHALGIVHRDLKPDNIFITGPATKPVLKLIDFGIAKLRSSEEFQRGLTGSGMLMGTPEYMAPEQAYSAADVDARADIYSLGVILYELLSGRRPVDGENAAEIASKVIAGKGTPLAILVPSLPGRLTELIQQALAPDRERRPASAFDMTKQLNELARELGLPRAELGSFDTSPASLTGSTPITADDPAMSAVPKTLPPDNAPEVAVKGATQDAPPLSLAAQTGAAFATTAAAHSVLPPNAKPKRRSSVVLVLLSLGAIALASAIVILYLRTAPNDTPPPLLGLDAGSSVETVDAAKSNDPPSTPGREPPLVTQPPTPTYRPPASHTHNATDAGTDAGWGIPPFTFPSSLPTVLPSTFPPLPSSLPTTFPSTFPPWPGLAPGTTNSGSTP